MKKEKLRTVELIEFNDFKEKINITKKKTKNMRIEIIEDRYIYIEKWIEI